MQLRRLPITGAIAALLVAVALLAGMWLTAWGDERIAPILRPNYGNHGVWRRHATINVMYDHLMAYTWLVALPLTLIGGWMERHSRRAQWVAVVVLVIMVTGCVHFPLFE